MSTATDHTQANFRREEITVVTVPTLFVCVECNAVFARNWLRCPICEHGPENSQPTFKPLKVGEQ